MDRLWIVDRIEGDRAVCLDLERNQRIIPLSELAQRPREGDCLREGPRGYTADQDETRRRRAASRALLERLTGRGSSAAPTPQKAKKEDLP